jgi:HPt (histidine-containing phosphotransfer) domain-containing protein
MNFKELGEALGLDEQEYMELIELFVTSGGADFQRLKTALAASDLDQVARSAHTIKGAAGNLGLMDLHETAKHIEHDAGQHRVDGLAEAVKTLASQLDAIQNGMHA